MQARSEAETVGVHLLLSVCAAKDQNNQNTLKQ